MQKTDWGLDVTWIEVVFHYAFNFFFNIAGWVERLSLTPAGR